MAWGEIRLNDGYSIPSLAFGSGSSGNGKEPVRQIKQALDSGIKHIDTAQAYRNEEEVGLALAKVDRDKVFITTKYSGSDGLDIETSIQNSLNNLGVEYVDLYLIHNPRLAKPDIPTIWKKMENIKAKGLAKSIGVSNFGVAELQELVASAKVLPAVNQILFHPYVYAQQAPVIAFGDKYGIVTEGYSSLIPVRRPGGPLDPVLGVIATKLRVSPIQVLLAWSKAKGAVVVTSSSRKERLEEYLDAGDIELSTDDVISIDAAGAKGQRRERLQSLVSKTVAAMSVLAVILVLVSKLTVLMGYLSVVEQRALTRWTGAFAGAVGVLGIIIVLLMGMIIANMHGNGARTHPGYTCVQSA